MTEERISRVDSSMFRAVRASPSESEMRNEKRDGSSGQMSFKVEEEEGRQDEEEERVSVKEEA